MHAKAIRLRECANVQFYERVGTARATTPSRPKRSAAQAVYRRTLAEPKPSVRCLEEDSSMPCRYVPGTRVATLCMYCRKTGRLFRYTKDTLLEPPSSPRIQVPTTRRWSQRCTWLGPSRRPPRPQYVNQASVDLHPVQPQVPRCSRRAEHHQGRHLHTLAPPLHLYVLYFGKRVNDAVGSAHHVHWVVPVPVWAM